MSREILVGPVDYGQHVLEESAPQPSLDPASSGVELEPGELLAGAGDLAEELDISEAAEADTGKFKVKLSNFEGPFDLLLQLIGKHKLDVTEIALHQVTDDFIAYIRAMGDNWDLGETSEFLLVAATLLDLKAARLLPAAEVEDEEDLALLEARDLLFARLLQYKAYKEAAAFISQLEEAGARRWPRDVAMEQRYAEALPDLVLGIGPDRLFKLALKQFLPKPGPPTVSIAHIHQVRVSVREHAQTLRERLRRAGSATFSLLVADCENTLEVVARFLALLELYREGLIEFEQPVSLDELTVRWVGGDAADADLDIDDYEGSKPEPGADDDPASSKPGESVTEADLLALNDPDESGLGVDPLEPEDADMPDSVRRLDEAGLPDLVLPSGDVALPDFVRSSDDAGVPDSRRSSDESDLPDGGEWPDDSADGRVGTSGATLSDSAEAVAESLDLPVTPPDLDMHAPDQGGNRPGGSENENTAGGYTPAQEEHRE